MSGRLVVTGRLLSHKSNTLELLSNFAALPVHYERDRRFMVKTPYATAANRYTLLLPNRLTVNINDSGYALLSQVEVDLSVAANWDSVVTDYTVAATRAGLNFYIYACQQAGSVPKIVLSANSTAPAGYTADNSRKIGGFHCLCLNAGTISGHTLTGFLTGDVLPASVWDLKHRPACDPAGMVWSEEAGIWVDIYLASGTGANTASANGATISDTRDWNDFVDDGMAVKKRLLRDTEFQQIAAGSNEKTNITGSADPVTTTGHLDTAGRRMISNIGCEDCCGVMWQWLDGNGYRYDMGTPTYAAIGQTHTIYHAAAPGGNPVYVKETISGVPYLCCNLDVAKVNKVLSFGTYRMLLVHDAAAAVDSFPLYFQYNGTLPFRFLINNTISGKDIQVQSNDPKFRLYLKHDAAAATNGVELKYDDGADNRLEYISPGSANATIDLARPEPAWGWQTLAGNKGSFYKQGTYGDVKLRAGAYWSSGAISGSRARGADRCRWSTVTDVGGRFASEPKYRET